MLNIQHNPNGPTFSTGGTQAGTKPRSSPHTSMCEAACEKGGGMKRRKERGFHRELW